MTPIEIMALIVALVSIIKMIVFLIRPKSWMKVPNKIYAQPVMTMIVSLLLAAGVLYYLLAELTIIQVFATLLFVILLMLSTLSPYSKEFLEMANKLLKD